MEKSENDSVEDKIDQGHSENVNEQKPDNSSTNKDEDRWEDKLNEAYGKQDDLQNKYLRVHADLENLKNAAFILSHIYFVFTITVRNGVRGH